MTLSQAILRVNAAYVPGVVQYFGKLSPDPWQAAHDELEKIAGIFDPAIEAPACERFVARCMELIERFKQDGRAPKSISPADGFAMGSDRAVRAHLSRRQKHCAVCGTKEGLKIVRVSSDPIEVILLCPAHASRQGVA